MKNCVHILAILALLVMGGCKKDKELNSLVGSYLVSGENHSWSHADVDSMGHYRDDHYPLSNIIAVFTKNHNSTIHLKVMLTSGFFENDLEYKSDKSNSSYYNFSKYTLNSNNSTDNCEIRLYKTDTDYVSIS